MQWLMSPEVLIHQGPDPNFNEPSVTLTFITGKHTHVIV